MQQEAERVKLVKNKKHGPGIVPAATVVPHAGSHSGRCDKFIENANTLGFDRS